MPSRNLPTFRRIEDMPLDWQPQARAAIGQTPKSKKKRTERIDTNSHARQLSGSKINPDGSILLIVPHPPKSCSPNGKSRSWIAVRNAKIRLKDWVSFAVFEAFSTNPKPNWKSSTVQYIWYRRKGPAPDDTNIIGSMKAAEDYLQECGILENDRGVTMLPPMKQFDPVSPRVEIIIRERKA